MAFARRIINLRFDLGEGDFGRAGQNSVQITGLRCSAFITKAGSVGNQQCELRIWGMPLELMNRLTVLNKMAYPQQTYNSVVVEAGDEQSGTAVAFVGNIQEAWADGRNPPDVMFHVLAITAMTDMIKPIPPTSYKGSVDIAIALGGIAQQMELTLENGGVTGKINDPYWPGSLGAQLRAMCKAVDCEYLIDETERILAVWPKGKARASATVRLAADSGMVGYPSFTQNGVRISSLYNPNLAYGKVVTVESEFTAAQGQWQVAAVTHSLDAGVPGGEWFTEIECGLLGQGLPIID